MAKFTVTIEDVSQYVFEGIEAEDEDEAEKIAMAQFEGSEDENFTDQYYNIDTVMTDE